MRTRRRPSQHQPGPLPNRTKSRNALLLRDQERGHHDRHAYQPRTVLWVAVTKTTTKLSRPQLALRDRTSGVLLIHPKSGKRLGGRQVQLDFDRWVKQGGITRPFLVHSIRHTFASRLYQKTGDLYLVRRTLGHRQITTTRSMRG